MLIGKGERGEEQQLLALATAQGWAAMIDNRGWQEPAAIPRLLASADVALAPIRDTLINRARGMAKLVELIAAGLPIVASDVGAARDYLAPEAGILVPPGNAQALAAATLELLADETARARLRAAAKRLHTAWHGRTSPLLPKQPTGKPLFAHNGIANGLWYDSLLVIQVMTKLSA